MPAQPTASTDKLAHDLRGQLCSIVLAATLIHEGKAGPVTALQREFGELISSQAEAVLEGINELERRAREADSCARQPSPKPAQEPA